MRGLIFLLPTDNALLDLAALAIELVNLLQDRRRGLKLARHFEQLPAARVELGDLGARPGNVLLVRCREFLPGRLDRGGATNAGD